MANNSTNTNKTNNRLSLNTKYDIENPGPVLRQAQQIWCR